MAKHESGGPAPAWHNGPPKVNYMKALIDKVFFSDNAAIKAMPSGDKCVLVMIARGMGYDNDAHGYSASFIAKALGEDVKTTKKRIARIRDLPWIEFSQGKGRSPNQYRATYTAAEYETLITGAVAAINHKNARSRSNEVGQLEAFPPVVGPPNVGQQSSEGMGQQTVVGPQSEGSESVVGPLPNASRPTMEWAKTNRTNNSKQASSQDNGSTAVPLSVDAEWMKQKLEPFGTSGMKWAQRLRVFLKTDLEGAICEMEMQADTNGPLNVVEAIQDVVSVTDIRTTPVKCFRSYVTTNTNKHGKRQMPKQVVEPQVRILSMAERGFPTC